MYGSAVSDDECAAAPCGCGGDWVNACLEGDCKIDADCGEGGYCSPSFGYCGNYHGVIAYYCHTAEDECINDSECVEMNQGYCAYVAEVGHWACSYSHCAG